jgi:hypothetical protein
MSKEDDLLFDEIGKFLQRKGPKCNEDDQGYAFEAYGFLKNTIPGFQICEDNDDVLWSRMQLIKKKYDNGMYEKMKVEPSRKLAAMSYYSESLFLDLITAKTNTSASDNDRKPKEKLTPLNIENRNEVSRVVAVIEAHFGLPYFEKEAYLLRIRRPGLLKEINRLRTQIKKDEEVLESMRPILDSRNSKQTDKIEKSIKISTEEISRIEDQINDFKGAELSRYFHPEGILQLQKQAFIRIYNNWDEISLKIESYMQTLMDQNPMVPDGH